MQRGSGVLMHISSLPGDYRCGAFGRHARKAVDLFAKCGFKYWQVLPFMIPDGVNSPYKSVSAFAGNPWFIDLEELFAEGWISVAELASERQRQPFEADFAALRETRLGLLKNAAKRALASEKVAAAVDEFIASHPQIGYFCEFIARREANDDRALNEWTVDTFDAESERAWQFIQYEFFREWQELRAYANKAGLKIIGDIPIYVDSDSADVWANKKQFQLDKNGAPKAVAGCPPDYFSEDGQLWGNPIYNWAEMKKDGYKWWEERLRCIFELFDAVRIDHFRAFASYWSIPADAETAKEGKWVVGPRKPFIDMVKRVAAECGGEVIAEDLGESTPDVDELLEYSGFPGMRVLQFGFLDESESEHQPHRYIKNCASYSGTHDNNTTLGFLYELEPAPKRRMYEYCGYFGESMSEAVGAVVRTLMSSVADLAIFPVQDLLGYGKDTRMNTPGVASGMWGFRLTTDQLEQMPAAQLRRYNEIYCR